MYKNDEYKSAVKRIQNMERCFDNAQNAAAELKKAIEAYSDVLKDIELLRKYYGSNEWKSDFEADEAGIFPKELKRGVLSEDGIWNFLDNSRELAEALQELSEKIIAAGE